MILLAESGTTKTDWRLIDKGIVLKSFSSKGINPIVQQLDYIVEEQKSILSEVEALPIVEIHFYGAGCGTKESKQKINLFLSTPFPNALIVVDSDLMAAAKALFGESSGIACILGTGSNSGLYNGKEIVERVPSLGYLLGDEGSGNQIGKRLIRDFLRNAMPTYMMEHLQSAFDLNENLLLTEVYSNKFPNRYLASFVSELANHFECDAYLLNVVSSEIRLFFERCLSQYPSSIDLPIGFVGSIAFHFQDIIRKIAKEYSFEVAHIIKQPINELVFQFVLLEKLN